MTAAAVNALIDKITVSERAKDASGKATQRIKIYYKFVGNLHEQYIAVPKRTCYMEEKACLRCGKMYLPGSNIAMYCPECKKAVKREYGAKQYIRRHGGKRLVQKPCECCGVVFMPKSHNDRFCADCAVTARKAAAKEWSKAYYQKKKALASVDS